MTIISLLFLDEAAAAAVVALPVSPSVSLALHAIPCWSIVCAGAAGTSPAAWVGALQETRMSAVHTPMPSDLLIRGWQDHGARCRHADPEASTGAAPEVADVFRTYGEAYRATHRLSGQQLRVMQAIETCRTAALGGHTWRSATGVAPRSCGTTRVAIATVPRAKPWPSCAGWRRVAQSF